MKFTIAAAALPLLLSSAPNHDADAFTPSTLSSRGRDVAFGARRAVRDGINSGTIHHRPTRNNVGRRRIKAWHKLELQPWAALRMSAAVDEPTSVSVTKTGLRNGAVDTVNGSVRSAAEAAIEANAAAGSGSSSSAPHAPPPPSMATTAAQARDLASKYLSTYEGESGAAVIYSKLQEHGVSVVNGYSGGAILPLLDQFHVDHPRHGANPNQKPIRWITNSNESSAGHVAEGIAKSSTEVDGRLAAGIVVATSGPGVTNLVTPLQDAICDGVPIIVLCGQAATTAPEAAFQFAPAVDITRPCTKWSYQIRSAAEVPFVMDYAFYVARQGRPGPVFIDLPKDLQNQVISSDGIAEFADDLRDVTDAKGAPFVKLLQTPGVNGDESTNHVIHLGTVEEGLPFAPSADLTRMEPVEWALAGEEDDAFRMDHHQSNTIYGRDGTWGELGGTGPASGAVMTELIRMLRRAKNPVIIAGQGCNDASPELTEFAESLQIPVATTLHGLGCFDERHPLALNMLGMHGHPTPNFMVQEADLVVCIGSRFDDRITGRASDFIPEARRAEEEGRGGVVHVDVRFSENAKQVAPTYFVHSTGKQFLRSVNDALREIPFARDSAKSHTRPWLDRMRLLQEEYPVMIPRYKAETVEVVHEATGETNSVTRTKMSAQHVISTLNDLILQAGAMDDAIFTTGVGIHQMVSAQLITWTQPRQMLSSGSLGTMGVALGYAVGAKLANGKKMVIAIDGDGSFNMTFTELKTVAEQKIPVKIMILDNESQMMVEYWQRLFHEGRYLAVRNDKNPEYTKLADAFGIKNIYVDAEEDLEAAMQEFLFADPDDPVLMHVRIERTPCLPLVAPGEALENMILVDGEEGEMDAGAAPS